MAVAIVIAVIGLAILIIQTSGNDGGNDGCD